MIASSVDIQVPLAAPGVMLIWGDRSVTSVIDGAVTGRSLNGPTDPLLRKLMAVRLRFIADEIEAGLEVAR